MEKKIEIKKTVLYKLKSGEYRVFSAIASSDIPSEITNKEISEILGVTIRSVEQNIKKLKDQGYIQSNPTGPGYKILKGI